MGGTLVLPDARGLPAASPVHFGSIQTMGRLAAILLSTVLPVTVAAIAFGAYLCFGSARMSYLGLIDSRLTEIASRIDATAEKSLSLGIPLAGQQTLNGVLARERAADPDLLSIDVADGAGTILFSSMPARVGTAFEADPAEARVRRARIDNPFGLDEGDVMVRASQAAIDRNLDSLARDVFTTAAAACAVALVLAVLAILLPLRRLYAHALDAAGHSEEPAAAMPPTGRLSPEVGWALTAIETEHDRIGGRPARPAQT